jgi:hypothetical protein
LTESVISGKKSKGSNFIAKEAMLSWIVNSWDKVSAWVTNQPAFVEVACGIGLFYVALQAVKLSYKLLVFLLAPLAATPARFKKQKDMRPKPRGHRAPPPDDDSPPFVFR